MQIQPTIRQNHQKPERSTFPRTGTVGTERRANHTPTTKQTDPNAVNRMANVDQVRIEKKIAADNVGKGSGHVDQQQ